MSDIIDCPALHERAKTYPERFNGKVPKTVRMLQSVRPEALGALIDSDWVLEATFGASYPAWTNKFGAVAVVFPNGVKLGVKPDEFEITEWHEQPT